MASKLEKLIGMLGSSFDGERASAALLISQMAAKEKLSIVELLRKEFGGDVQYVRPKPKSTATDYDDDWGASHILNELRNVRTSYDLTGWERKFVADILRRYHKDSELSFRQRETAEKIINKFYMAE